MTQPSFICPDCKMESFHPKDVEHRYCGNCHKFFGNQAHAAVYAQQHLQMLQIKEQYPEEYEQALEALRCMYGQKSSGRLASLLGKLRRALTRSDRPT